MTLKQFFKLATLSTCLLLTTGQFSCGKKTGDYIMTVNGTIQPQQLGVTLPHEHILVDFIGAGKVSKDRYHPDSVVTVALPYLQQLREMGCQAFFECTPAFLGRDPVLFKRLSDASGLHIITNTGYYGARQNQHLPAHAFTETADQLAERWVDEWRNGIDNTGIKPGFIKIGIERGSMSDLHRKLVQAAARAHLKTGLTIAAHTGTAIGAFEELKVLKDEGVDPGAFVWVHAQAEPDTGLHIKAAQMGAWLSFDGFNTGKTEQYVQLIATMKTHNLLNRVLLSHDAGWYHVGEPGGGSFRGFAAIFIELIPALKANGFSDTEIDQLFVNNPAQAFSIKVRAAATI